MLFFNLFKKKVSTSKHSKGDAKKNTNKKAVSKSTESKALTLSLAKSMLGKGEKLNEKTLHKTTIDGVEMKYCSCCGEWLPIEEFCKDKRNKKDGLCTCCKACRSKKRYSNTDNSENRNSLSYAKALLMLEEGEKLDRMTYHKISVDGVELKYCTGCGRWLPVEEFCKDSRNKRDGFSNLCSNCRHERNSAEKRQNKYAYPKAIPSVDDDEIIDEEINHKLTKDGVEMKFCKHCGRWLTLDRFYHYKRNRDGLVNCCIDCFNRERKKRNEDKGKKVVLKKESVAKTKKADKEESSVKEKQDFDKDLKNAENGKLKKKLDKYEEEINRIKIENKSLKKENNTLKEKCQGFLDAFEKDGVIYENGKVLIPKTNEKELKKEVVERYLLTHNDITLRTLFNAISRADTNTKYKFFYKDLETGIVSPIAEDVYA